MNALHSFEALIPLYVQKVYRMCLSILQNKEDAEDCTQEVFTKIYLNLADFKEESTLNTWIHRIVVNQCNEHFRKKNRKKRFGFHVSTDDSEAKSLTNFNHPGIVLEQSELSQQIFRAIANLPTNQRIAFSMYNMDGFSYQEIADAMELSLSAVESLIFRARQQLKIKLKNI